jgi:hypothetical protein
MEKFDVSIRRAPAVDVSDAPKVHLPPRYPALLGLMLLLALGQVLAREPSQYYTHWCGHTDGLQILDDAQCAKVFPGNGAPPNREWVCPATVLPNASMLPVGFVPDGTPLSQVPVDTTSLADLVPDTVNLCLIVIQRVASATAPAGVSIYNKYFCAGDRSRDQGTRY